jgi:hypothetical protein
VNHSPWPVTPLVLYGFRSGHVKICCNSLGDGGIVDLVGIPEEFRGCVSDDGTQLLLVGVQLTEVPYWVRNLTALTELNMGENQLTVDGRG